MFCTKCGTQNPDGAGYCVKCGTKLVTDEQPSQATQSSQLPPTASAQRPQQYSVSSMPQKKKSKAPVVLGIVGGIVALFILVGIIGIVVDSQENQPLNRQESSVMTSSSGDNDKVELSKTYVNANEGISFQYPGEWEKVPEAEWGDYLEVSDRMLVLLVRIDEDDPTQSSMLLVRKYDVPIEEAQEMFFSNETEFLELYSDVDIKGTSVTKIDTIPAREIRYLDDNGDGCQSYFYIAGAYTYKIEIYWTDEDPGKRRQVFDAVMDSYTIHADKLEAAADTKQETPEVKPTLPYGYEWVEGPTTTDDDYPLIEGVIRNNTGTNIPMAFISFNLYDGNGNLIENAGDSISDWQNGTAWKFSANGYAAFAYYEFASLDVFDFS